MKGKNKKGITKASPQIIKANKEKVAISTYKCLWQPIYFTFVFTFLSKVSLHHFQEVFMYTRITIQFRMKSSNKLVSLASSNNMTINL